MSVLSASTLPASQGFLHGPQRLQARYSLDDLIYDIKAHLGTSGGISSEDVDEDYLISLAQKYNTDLDDWLPFYYNDRSKNYTRNAIENINHKANIVSRDPGTAVSSGHPDRLSQLLLVWNPGKGSPIHDHAHAHCIMKVLAGQLRETVYHAPSSKSDTGKPLEIKSENIHSANDVAYISDDIGLHRVDNPSSNRVAVSLHCT